MFFSGTTRVKDCKHCRFRSRCLSEKSKTRIIIIRHGYASLLRARRRHKNPDKKFYETYARHRFMIEGMHGEAKTQHGLRRAVRRGLENVSIQAFLTAAVINLKRLVKHTDGLYGHILRIIQHILDAIVKYNLKNRFLHIKQKTTLDLQNYLPVE